jgi:hypothetical protein
MIREMHDGVVVAVRDAECRQLMDPEVISAASRTRAARTPVS